jgi:GR25 family glycosyltransferase involved in LPS biosynthesis
MNLLEESYKAFINLDHRQDRLSAMRKELARIGIEAERFPALKPADVINKLVPASKVEVMRKRTPGAIGCHYSQVAIMYEAYTRNQHAFVMEDDLIFCDDFKERIEIIEDFLKDKEWDVIWLGGTYHKEPTWHKAGHSQLPECNCSLGKDVEPTDSKYIVRTYGCWSTYAYIVNKDSLDRIIGMLDSKVYLSMGIDWLFILLEPLLKTYAFVPGCIRQRDGKSDIGNGDTIFSNFQKLGNHWFNENRRNFNYENFKI